MHMWDPADYEKSSSAQFKWAMDLIAGLNLKGSERALDIGCGDGKITARLADLLPEGKVVGVDLSPEMISFARSNHSPEKSHNLSFQVADAADLPFREEFDLVVSFACLHWIRDHQPVLSGIRHSLVPGGRILLQCGGLGNAADLLDLATELFQDEKWAEYFQDFRFPYNFYSPEQYRIWLKEAGLEEKRVQLVPKVMVHQGQAGLEGFIRTTWLPYTEMIPERLRPEFVREIARLYLERHPLDENELAHIRMMRLQVEARKPE